MTSPKPLTLNGFLSGRALASTRPSPPNKKPPGSGRLFSDVKYPGGSPVCAGTGRGPSQAVRPFGSARPLARQAAVRVLARRHAMVIGPTPPGTGVMAPATRAALS
jgi:hypothetical protein